MMTEQTPILNEFNNLLGKMMIVGEESCWDYGFLQRFTDREQRGKHLISFKEKFWSEKKAAPLGKGAVNVCP